MSLSSLGAAIAILPGFANDPRVRLVAIAGQPPAQNNSMGATAYEFDFRTQHASIDGTPEANRVNALVLGHLSSVRIIAASLRANLPVHVDVDDLIQAGTLGLMDAAHKFDATKQIAFSTYAKYRIKGAILDSLRDLDEASRDMRRLHKQVELATGILTQVLQRAPDDGEIAEKLGMKVESLRVGMLHVRSATRILTASRTDEGLSAPDFPTGPETCPDVIWAQKKLQNIVRVALKQLPQRDQTILLSFYGGEMTMKKIGGMLGINESRVSQLHKRAIRSMELRLLAIGITSSHPL